jgi:hypothetical protein
MTFSRTPSDTAVRAGYAGRLSLSAAVLSPARERQYVSQAASLKAAAIERSR